MSAACALLAIFRPCGARAENTYYADAQVGVFREYYRSGEKDGFRNAARDAAQDGYPMLARMLLWEHYRRNGAIKSREDVVNAVRYFYDWPDWESVQRNIERSSDDVSVGVYAALFDKLAPTSTQGTLLKARLEGEEAKKSHGNDVREAWRKTPLEPAEENYWLTRYRDVLTNDDVREKIEYLTYNGYTDKANRLINALNSSDKALYEAWAKYKRGELSVRAAFSQAGPKASTHPLFMLEAVKADVANERFESAYRKLASLPERRAAVEPDAWWGVRKRVARELFDEHKYREAYAIVSAHGFDPGGTEFAEAEWMSGWLALSFMRKYDRAEKHFRRMAENVEFPISVARGYYWLGRSYAAEGKTKEAASAFDKAIKYDATFYGQIARLHVGDKKLDFPRRTALRQGDKEAAEKSSFVKIAQIWHDLGRHDHYKTFIQHAIDIARTDGERLYIASLPLKLKENREAIELARYAYKDGAFIPEISYPRLPSKVADLKSRSAIVHAVILQESRFDPSAKSAVGAAGLMQLMPETAQHLAKKLGLSGNPAGLTLAPASNVKMGAAYLDELLEQFNGSRVMTAAAYNAGAGKVNEWRERFGNPMKAQSLDQVINWIEIIPFYETRNYVQRVIENANVYSAMERDEPMPVSAELFL